MRRSNKKSQFSLDTALVFLLVILIIFVFNIFKIINPRKVIILEPKRYDLIKIYPLLNYRFPIDYNGNYITLNIHDVVYIYNKTGDPKIVNVYCKTLKKIVNKIYLKIGDTEFSECKDDVGEKVIFSVNSEKGKIFITFGITLPRHEGIYTYFYNKYKSTLT